MDVESSTPQGEMDAHLRSLRLSGFSVIRNVVPSSDVEAVRRSVNDTVERVSGYSEAGVGFLSTVLNHNQAIVPYLGNRRLLDLIERLIGPFAHVSFASAIINAPGNTRGRWHSDWPFNQELAGRIPSPYPDALMHLTSLWMLSPFTIETGGTLVVPGSHHSSTNPTGDNGFDPHEPVAGELNATGEAGDVLLFDSRLWHATATNSSDMPRVALAIRFAPWWLDVSVLRPGSRKRVQMVDETGGIENEAPSLLREVYDQFPEGVRDLFRHMVV